MSRISNIGTGSGSGGGGGGSGSVTSVSVTTANGVSGSVANPTTTPAISLTLGAITPTSVNGLTITSSTGTLTIANGKTATINNSLTFAGTDTTTMTFPTTSATIARTDASNTFTGHQTIEGTTTTGSTGTNNLVFSNSPAISTPKIGTAINDINGNPLIAITATGSAVNGLSLTNSATNNAVALALGGSGSDANINFNIDAKGNGTITLNGTATGTVSLSNASIVAGTVVTAGDSSTKIATTAFVTTAVNNAIAGVNPAVAVQYATVAAGDTSALAYANGVSGIGATLTGANNTTTAIDGHTFVVGDVGITRVLVKNDTQSPSGAFNGVYLFTALHTSITGDIFTRALDYDQPSDINNTGAIPVISGTVNALTSWIQTANIVTIGTTPLAYSQFSLSPIGVIPPNLGGTGVANNSASTITLASAKTLTVNNSLTFAGTDSTTMTFPATSDTVAGLGTAQTFTATNTEKQINFSNNAITASANAATVPITSRLNTVTNNSAATLTITMATTSAVDGQLSLVRILDHSAVVQTIAWVNTENSTILAPTTSNGSTTLFLTVGFIFNGGTSKWRTIGVA